MVEIVVAMFVLALMSIGILPLMLNSIRESNLNREIVAATALANDALAEARNTVNSTSTCAALKTWRNQYNDTAVGKESGATATIGACPSTYPGTVVVTVTVVDGTKTLTELTTKVAVDA